MNGSARSDATRPRPGLSVRRALLVHLVLFLGLVAALAVAWRPYWPVLPYLAGLAELPRHPLAGTGDAGATWQGRSFTIRHDADVRITEAGDDATWMTTFAWGEQARFWLIETNEAWGARDFVSAAAAEDARTSFFGQPVEIVTLSDGTFTARARTIDLGADRPGREGEARVCVAALGLEAQLQGAGLVTRLPLAETCRVAPVALTWPRAWHIVYQGLDAADAARAEAMIATLRFSFSGAHARNALGEAIRPGS